PQRRSLLRQKQKNRLRHVLRQMLVLNLPNRAGVDEVHVPPNQLPESFLAAVLCEFPEQRAVARFCPRTRRNCGYLMIHKPPRRRFNVLRQGGGTAKIAL